MNTEAGVETTYGWEGPVQPPLNPRREAVDTQGRLVEKIIDTADADGDPDWTVHQVVRRRRGA